jgi:hypothetical protein
MVIWNIFPRFGKSYREKSGNPELETVETEKVTQRRENGSGYLPADLLPELSLPVHSG